MRIGVIGGGAIATFLLDEIEKHPEEDVCIRSVFVRNREKYIHLEAYGVTLYTDLTEFLKSPIDLVVEAATVELVPIVIPTVLTEKDVILISIGALVDETFLQQLEKIATTNGTSLYLPAGAIGGLDLLQNAEVLGGVEDVTLTTKKPAHTLTSEKLTKEKVIFSGSARGAIAEFPQNVNVAIVLSLAGIGMDQTKVRIVADPATEKNTHSIEINGIFGSAVLTVENEPLQANPRTSYLAAMSVLRMCLDYKGVIKIA